MKVKLLMKLLKPKVIMDTRTLKLIELFDYSSSYDEDYLNGLIAKASKTWKGIDAEEWLNEIRGDYTE